MPGTVFVPSPPAAVVGNGKPIVAAVSSKANDNSNAASHANGQSTPVPDESDAERMHKYITDRRVVGVGSHSLNGLLFENDVDDDSLFCVPSLSSSDDGHTPNSDGLYG